MFQIRLYVMCEQEKVRRGLSAIFASEDSFEVVGEVGLEPDSISGAQKNQPDAIICELKTGEKSTEMIRLIKEACPYTKVFVFIHNETSDEVFAAIAAGADGCLTKTMLPNHLVKTVELTCRTEVICLPGSIKRLVVNLQESLISRKNLDKREYASDGQIDEMKLRTLLTAREVEIYGLITQNCSNKEIGKKLFISLPTVKSHVSSILRKMAISNRTQLVLNEMQSKGMSGAIEAKKDTAFEINSTT